MLNNLRLNRFMLRGQHKAGVQWRLYCLVHNIKKLAGFNLKQRERPLAAR